MIDTSAKLMIAEKDWVIITGAWSKKTNRHETEIRIKKGDDLSEIPTQFIDVLKREKVLKE